MEDSMQSQQRVRRSLSAVAGVVALAVSASINTPASVAQSQGGALDPALLAGVSFRHLSVSSRGGRSTAVAGVPGNEQLYYLGTTGGGLWQTTNAGESWSNISDGF